MLHFLPVSCHPLQRASQYIEDLIPDLRKVIQKLETPAKKKGSAEARWLCRAAPAVCPAPRSVCDPAQPGTAPVACAPAPCRPLLASELCEAPSLWLSALWAGRSTRCRRCQPRTSRPPMCVIIMAGLTACPLLPLLLHPLNAPACPCTHPALQDFAPDVFNQVVAALKTDASMAGKSEKEIKAAVLPFAKFKMEEAAKVGAQVGCYAS